jgi:hypothetical protein
VDKLLYRQCQLRGIMCVKVASISNRGLPDRMLIGPGELFGFVEVKRARAKVTRLQDDCIRALVEAGVWVRIVWGGIDREQTLPVIEMLLDDYQHRRV